MHVLRLSLLFFAATSSLNAWYYHTVTNATKYDLDVHWVYDWCGDNNHPIKSGEHHTNNGKLCDLDRIDFVTKDKKKSGSFNHHNYFFPEAGSIHITIIEDEHGNLVVDKHGLKY